MVLGNDHDRTFCQRRSQVPNPARRAPEAASAAHLFSGRLAPGPIHLLSHSNRVSIHCVSDESSSSASAMKLSSFEVAHVQ